MQSTAIPTKFSVVWASGASSSYVRVVSPSSGSAPAGGASFQLGFPPSNFTPTASGGSPVDGRDANGVLNPITAWGQWYQAGGPVMYDSSFSSAIGGYPKGAILQMSSGAGLWRSTAENNTTDPDTGGAGWVAFLAPGTMAGVVRLTGSTTLTAAQVGDLVELAGTAASQTLKLPALSSLPSGISGLGFAVTNNSTQNWSVQRSGSDNLVVGSNASATGFTFQPGESFCAFNNGTTAWVTYGVFAAALSSADTWPVNISGNAATASEGSTAAAGDNSTNLATTAFVQGNTACGVGASVHYPSRVFGTTYTNTQGKPIQVMVTGNNGSAQWQCNVSIAGSNVFDFGGNACTNGTSFIVPPGSTYAVSATLGSPGLVTWAEIY